VCVCVASHQWVVSLLYAFSLGVRGVFGGGICDCVTTHQWSVYIAFSSQAEEYRLFYESLLQKRPIILRSLLVCGTAY